MNIYFIYLLIFLVNVILFIIIENKIQALTIIGYLTLTASIVLTIIMFIIKVFINNIVTLINLSVITNYIFKKILFTSLILFLIGLAEVVISKYISILKESKTII